MVKYDIPTLLDLRQDARIDLTRFSDQAFGNNLLRQRQASTSVLSEQPVNRSRNASNYSRQSERTLSIIEPAVLRPSRQPSDPPQGVRAQTDAGFARFLKEHTSPKHQRVTAGGRIVPMEPSSPTPKPKELVPSKDVKMDDEIMSKVASKNENKSKLENRQLQPTDANASINMPKAASQLAGSHVNQPLIMHPSGTLDQQFSGCGQIPNLLSAAATTGIFSQPNLPWSLDNQQLPQLGLQVPDITLSAASDYGMYNFGADPYTWLPNMYQALNTQGPIAPSMPTVQPYPTVTTSSDFSTGSNTSSGGAASIFSQFPTGYESVYPSLGLQWQQYTGGQVPLLTPPVVPSPLQTPTYQKSLEDAAKEHESLTGQLSRIDRYMAIHSWDLDQQSKNLLVEQRMSLVRELDAVRIYREHLEWASGRFGTSASLRHNVMNPATAPANMYAANSLAGSQTLLGPGLCAASSSCTAPTFPMFPLMNALSQPLTMSEPMNAAAAPFHATVDTHPYENNTFQAEACASRTSFREAGLKPPRAVGTCAEPLRSDKEVQTLSEAKPISRDKPVAGWKTPTKDGPPELRKVYDQIEEAVRRGEPLGGLLKDLSAATSQLVKERVSEKEERYGSLRSPSSKPGKPHAKAHTGSEAYALKGISDRHEAYAPFARPSRKLWKSGNDLRRPIHGKNRPFGVEDEDDVKSTSSYLSTTDSWATIHEGDRCLDKLAPEGKGKGVCRDVLPERRPRDPFERPTVSAEALRSTIRRTGAQNLSVTGELAAYKPRSSATLMGSNNSGRQTSVEEMRQPYPQLLTQYFNKDRGLAFQKTAALAVSQNVNAHGFLPPFEGVGNAPQSRRKAKECAEP
ncbi:hypothetical protein BO70DRAFT_424100 [Aspergillus heteromorphus CBS 117.55]|uniref:Uncharacterized protein n=1 Tax=Aspergillus heteromorphus CBS 117.55 TaxID=1448321 RepID=A0A317WEN4_9EURO|nr:uncharacterized protein BO70DRAFT_424100 [Aspergillus heteromorphus CBS 117.55]PWY84894.1 hypothetical protein BO70DRAFT_424100 [Aspergillus heteromorphus CBS 117.55]